MSEKAVRLAKKRRLYKHALIKALSDDKDLEIFFIKHVRKNKEPAMITVLKYAGESYKLRATFPKKTNLYSSKTLKELVCRIKEWKTKYVS